MHGLCYDEHRCPVVTAKRLWRLGFLLISVLCFFSFPPSAFSRNADYSIGLIQKPLSTYPVFVLKGQTFDIQLKAGSSASSFAATLKTAYFSRTLSLSSTSYNASSGIWTLTAQVPSDTPVELYNLEVSSSAGTDTSLHAVRVLDGFPSDYYFIQISDTQPYLPDHYTKLDNLISQINLVSPEYVIVTGDIVEFGTETEWRTILPYFDKLEVPAFFVPGNHDIFWVDCCRRDMYIDRWKKFAGPLEYSFDFGGAHHTILHISGYEGTDPEVTLCAGSIGTSVTACPYADMDSSQVSWLAQDLQSATGKLKLVFGHQVEDDPNNHHPNLEETLQTYGASAYIYGHLHEDGYALKNGIHWVLTTTTHNGNYRLFRVSPSGISGFKYNNSAFSSIPAYNKVKSTISPSNNGISQQVSASLENSLNETFGQTRIRFVMPKSSKPYIVENGTIEQTVETDTQKLIYVKTTLAPYSAKTVTVKAVDATSPVTSESSKNPVLLIHGYGGSLLGNVSVDIYWAYIATRLQQDGFQVYKIALGWGALQDIAVSANEVKNKVTQILAETGAQKVDLVGHSEGGLVERYYIQKLGGQTFVDDCVGIASPNRGTIMSEIGPGTAADQMEVGSSFLRDLNQGDITPGAVDYTSLFSTADEMVVPQVNGYQHTAFNEVINLFGHVGIIANDTSYKWLKAALTTNIADGVEPVRINNGAISTKSNTVTLTFMGLNPLVPDVFSAAQMMASESSFFTGASYETFSETKSWTFSGSEGLRTIYVKFKDASGNESPVFSAQTLLDKDGPTGWLSANSGATTTKSQNVTLSLYTSDNADKYGAFNLLNVLTAFGLLDMGTKEMMVSNSADFSGAAYEPYAAAKPWTLTTGNGTKTVYIKFKDATGNESSVLSDTIVLDTTAPSLSVNWPLQDTFTKDANLTVTGQTDSSATLKVNNQVVSANADGTFSKQVTLSSGENTLTVTSQDSAGNVTTETRKVTLDTTAPTISITSPAEGAVTNQKTFTVTGTTEAGATVKVAQTNADVSSSGDFSASVVLSEGANTLSVEATDKAGNKTTATRSVTLDTLPPPLTVTSPSEGLVTGSSTITASGTTEAGANLTINGQTTTVASDGTFNQAYTWVNLALEQSVTVSSKDSAGNETNITRSFIYNVGVPPLEVSSPFQDTSTSSTSITVSGKTSSSGVTLTLNGSTVSLDAAGAFSNTVNLSSGLNTLTFEATNTSGQKSSVVRKITLDQSGPSLTLSTPSEGQAVNGASVRVSGTTEAGVTLTANSTTLPVSANGSFDAYVFVSESSPVLTVVAKDSAGNTTTLTRNLTVDKTAPALTVSSPLEGLVTNSTSVVVSGTTDADASVFVNGTAVQKGNGSAFQTTVSASPGAAQITVEAVDAAGNKTTIARNVFVDTGASSVYSVSVSSVTQTGATVTWQTQEVSTGQVEYGTSTGFGSLSAKETSPVFSHNLTLSGLSPGETYYFRILTSDSAGNTGVSSTETFTTALTYTATVPYGLSMFSLPMKADNPDTKTILSFSDTQLQDNVAYWNSITNRYEYYKAVHEPDAPVTKVAQGNSYWGRLPGDASVSVSGVAASKASSYSIPLYSGWNMISNPFNFPVKWTDCEFSFKGETKTFWDAYKAGWIIDYMWTYEDQTKGFEVVDPQMPFTKQNLTPGKGYFFYANYDTMTLLVPPKAQTQKQTFRALAKVDEQNFAVKLSVKGKTFGDAFNVAGVSSDSSLRKELSEPPVPSGSDEGVSLYFLKDGKKQAISIQEPGTTEWMFEVQNNGEEQDVTLTWNVSQAPQEMEFVVEEQGSGKSLTLQTDGEFTFRMDSGSAKAFKLKALGRLATVVRSFNYPNPFSLSTGTTIRLESTGTVVSMVVRLYSLSGHLVRTLTGFTNSPGNVYEIFWDGKNNSGNVLANGVYFYKLEAFGTRGEKISAKGKVALIK